MPRGDLYHWIPLLNRFDNILESFNKLYQLNKGSQKRAFGCGLLLGNEVRVDEYGSDEWDAQKLGELGYKDDGDAQLVQAILQFTRRLLSRCGNRSIYASSSHLNDLLNSTSLAVVQATLEVGLELAQRYQASVKRMTQPNRQVSNALLTNHYNIELERVQQIAQPFVKTSIISLTDSTGQSTPASASKGKEKDKTQTTGSRNTASSLANDLGSIISSDNGSDSRWKAWGDLKVVYYPKADGSEPVLPTNFERPNASAPSTPTPLRRSTTMTSQHTTPRTVRAAQSADDTPSPAQRSPAVNTETGATSTQRSVEIPLSVVTGNPAHELLRRTPEDMPKNSQYEFLNRTRVCKALLDGSTARQQALAVRLLAIANLAYIHPESVFLEQVLKQDNDEPRRFHLVYQLVELIHPSTPGQSAAPRWLQQIAFSILEGVSHYGARYQDVLSALNATVNHGVLLYVIRKAVAEMREDAEQSDEQSVELEDWRGRLFSLALHLALSGRIGTEMMSAGFMDALVEIVNMRTRSAERWHHVAVSHIDMLVVNYGPSAFQAFNSANGLDGAAQLMIDTTASAKGLADNGQGTKKELYSSVVDYEIPYFQQQTLKWLLKLIHHIMSPGSYPHGGNTDRLLRNLVDNSKLLGSLRTIMENTKSFGSVVWTNSISLLTDFINNDPTSFAAISETGMVRSLLESLTGRTIPIESSGDRKGDEPSGDENGAPVDESVVLEPDERPHPPNEETLRAPRSTPLACGVLPSAEAIGVIVPVINSICLNNTGMKLVASSRVLESVLEIFESPEHIRLMHIDQEIPYQIGLQIDELARHHPALRPTIGNAVLDMIARVRYLGHSKAESAGWGTKLLVTDANGAAVPADQNLLQSAGISTSTSKGKEIAASNEDVDMEDVAAQPNLGQPNPLDNFAKVPDSITPYVYALGQFLQSYVSNSSLRSSLTKNGGVNYLLDLLELPSLTHDFVVSPASRTLQQVIGQFIDGAPIIGVPSILNRLQRAIDCLEPLVSQPKSASYFQPFVQPGTFCAEENSERVRQVVKGTDVAKALLNLQSLLRTLHGCFPSSRQATVLPAVNVFDQFLQVIQSLGPLLRAALLEEAALNDIVPQPWVRSTGPRITHPSGILSGDSETVRSQGPGVGSSDAPIDHTDQNRDSRVTPQEQSSPQYQNLTALRQLLFSLRPSIYSFFQTIGKALLPRRERDGFARAKSLQIADALAKSVLEQLEQVVDEPVTRANMNYSIEMLHVVDRLLIDSTSRRDERPGPHIILPVLDAFKQRGGIELLNKLLKNLANEFAKESSAAEDTSLTESASLGLRRILHLYSLILSGKHVLDSAQSLSLTSSRAASGRQPEWYQATSQFVIELRVLVVPVIRDLWRSQLIERAPSSVVGRVVEILKLICHGENEGPAPRKGDSEKTLPLFKRDPDDKFPWETYAHQVTRLAEEYPVELAREAVYRALGQQDSASEYCRMHHKGLAGQRNPIPDEDAYEETPPVNNGSASQTPGSSRSSDLLRDVMATESAQEVEQTAGDETASEDQMADQIATDRRIERIMGQNFLGSSQSIDSESNSQNPRRLSLNDAAAEMHPGPSADHNQVSNDKVAVTKDDLDAERENLRRDLIDRCLDVIRAHPDSVFEVSELIQVAMAIDRPEAEATRVEVGDTLVNALMSFALDDDEKKTNGRSIAAYAHLLSLLLFGSKEFFKSIVEALRTNITEYLGFLKVPPGNSTDELPPWIPHVLLIFEMLLAEDVQPLEVKWTPPRSEQEDIQEPKLQLRQPIIQEEQRMVVLESVLEILPRTGKNESLAVAVLRILVILTRNRSMAKVVGDKRNLQRLFVMAKQLSGLGSARLKDTTISGNVMTILRHIIEDDDTVRQIMRTEIRKFFEQAPHRNSRGIDIPAYTRNLSQFALRSPEIFVEVTNETVKLVRFVAGGDTQGSNGRGVALMLRDKGIQPDPLSGSGSVSLEPAVQATEELTISDVKPTTETTDTEMVDAAKSSPAEPRRPVVENPDGVIHFLLCELLNYREVNDKEPLDVAKESATLGESSTATQTSTPTDEAPVEEANAENKDKKASKIPFKADEHPIFVYRCFLLNCLAELLQSYTRTKMEFINFKRSAPMFANTPVKPRTGVLNYLLQDLLCLSSLVSLGSPPDSIAAKKKLATSEQARQVLVALVARTSEKPIDRTRDRFDYDEDLDLLFVRKWVLDMILRAYKDAAAPNEPFDVRYTKLLSLAELMLSMIGEKDRDPSSSRISDQSAARSHMQLKRLMYEKGFLPALTASVADIDLTFPGVKRTIKYILRVLQVMTSTAIALSQANLIPSGPQEDNFEEEIASASSLSDLEDDREETPDLYRNSALGMLEVGQEEDYEEDDSDEDGKLMTWRRKL